MTTTTTTTTIPPVLPTPPQGSGWIIDFDDHPWNNHLAVYMNFQTCGIRYCAVVTPPIYPKP